MELLNRSEHPDQVRICISSFMVLLADCRIESPLIDCVAIELRLKMPSHPSRSTIFRLRLQEVTPV